MEEPSIIKEKLNQLPQKPGIYKFYDGEGSILYVGKAKDLRKRVSSYFNKNHDDRKTRLLVKQIEDIDFIITETDLDAYLLENNYIKSYQPKYNILLRDDKTYPFICISGERFPRIYFTRSKKRDEKAKYFGPYANVGAMRTILDTIYKIYHIRTCSLNLSEKNINNQKFKVCLEYHIGNCKGPCEALQTEEDYMEEIKQAENIIKGNLQNVKKHLHNRMKQFSAALRFEKAQQEKNKIDILDRFQAKSVIVNQKLDDIEVFTIASNDKQKTFVNYLKVSEGSIVHSKNMEVFKKIHESENEILAFSILNTRIELESQARTILTNLDPEIELDHAQIQVPKQGDKKKLVDLSLKNLAYKYQEEEDNKQKEKQEKRILKALQNDLSLPQLPYHIECFDNSNLFGTYPVAGMVCYKNGKPLKSEYRKFKIKNVEGINDFESMHEIVYRRYKRQCDENQPLPDLILIDGGKGQLNAAIKALKTLNIYEKVCIAGIAKRLEEIYFPNDEVPVYIDKKSESLKFLQQIRNETHRFAITYHRSKRDKIKKDTKK